MSETLSVWPSFHLCSQSGSHGLSTRLPLLSFYAKNIRSPLKLPSVCSRRDARFLMCAMLKEQTSLQALESMEASLQEHHQVPESLLLSDEECERKRDQKQLRRKVERYTYLSAAIASSLGITFLAAGAIYYRFAWQLEDGELSFIEMFGTFALVVGAAVGMEIWARWAHRALWHSSLWSMHESHHRPRDGPFELNDVFAITNAVPAIALMAYGFFHKGLLSGLCFGAGLGITTFGMAYMFVHDGLVHRRFPVGPIAGVPYLQRVAAAHQLHHADKYNGVPYGLFLGPLELEQVGGGEELDKLVRQRKDAFEKKL